MDLSFQLYKQELYSILLSEQPQVGLYNFSVSLTNKGFPAPVQYELFLKFHKDIQEDKRTKNNEFLYDLLSDFMDTLVD